MFLHDNKGQFYKATRKAYHKSIKVQLKCAF